MRTKQPRRLAALEARPEPGPADPAVLKLIDWLIEQYGNVVSWSLKCRLEDISQTTSVMRQRQEACTVICDFAEAAEEIDPNAGQAFTQKLDELERACQ